MVTNNTDINTTNKSLSIQINLSGLSFCILNCDTNTIDELESVIFSEKKNPETLLDAVKHEFNNNAKLHQEFKNIIVIHQNLWQTIVPKALFKEDNLTDYLKFNTKILATDFIGFDEITPLEALSVYVPYTNVNNYIFEQFGSFTYKHSSTVLLETLEKEEKNKDKKTVYLNIENDSFDIAVFNEGKLILFNSFDYITPEDFIYYVLFTFEQLQLNPEQVETFFTGKITEQDALYKLAYTYIRHVAIAKTDYKFQFTNTPFQKHYHFNLINAMS